MALQRGGHHAAICNSAFSSRFTLTFRPARHAKQYQTTGRDWLRRPQPISWLCPLLCSPSLKSHHGTNSLIHVISRLAWPGWAQGLCPNQEGCGGPTLTLTLVKVVAKPHWRLFHVSNNRHRPKPDRRMQPLWANTALILAPANQIEICHNPPSPRASPIGTCLGVLVDRQGRDLLLQTPGSCIPAVTPPHPFACWQLDEVFKKHVCVCSKPVAVRGTFVTQLADSRVNNQKRKTSSTHTWAAP